MRTNHIANATLELTSSVSNSFADQLARADSDLAPQTAIAPYVIDFLALTKGAAERDFEKAPTDNIVETLYELGPGFTFASCQVHFGINGDYLCIDLIIFRIEQMRYLVVQLKTAKFKPEYSGQLGFCVTIVDELLKREQQAPFYWRPHLCTQ